MSVLAARIGRARRNALFALLMPISMLSTYQIIHAHSTLLHSSWHQPDAYGRDVGSLVEKCPDPLEELSIECKDAMNQHFANLPLEYLSWTNSTWISLPNRLTYGRVFEDPVGDQIRVIEALRIKKCRLEEGEAVRWDLSEFCHADAFANLSVFLWACSLYDEVDNLSDRFDIGDYSHFEGLDPQQLEESLRVRFIATLEARWLNSHCTKYRGLDMRIDPYLEKEQHQTLHLIAKRLGDSWPEKSEVPESFVLKSLAARLGDRSAAVLYTGPSKGTDDSWRKYIAAAWPWRNSLPNFLSYTHMIYDRRAETLDRLQHGISMAVLLQESGLEFDWEFLVRRVCTLKNSEEATCKTAIGELDLTLEGDQNSKLEALAQFESVSRELNLYE
ncbi:MAG: hypothetical protein OXG24_00545 [Gammaproteobacteria bacterium]|nr:hypothetical protein [Gammaproteobacteria bacterium]